MFSLIKIPDHLAKDLLPPIYLPVTKFITFPLPHEITDSDASKSFHASDFLAFDTPPDDQLTPTTLQSIPLPPIYIIQDLAKVILKQSPMSLRAPHSPGHAAHQLPLWAVIYWHSVHEILPQQRKWLHGEKSLRMAGDAPDTTRHPRGDLKSRMELVNDTYIALASLGWGDVIRGFAV